MKVETIEAADEERDPLAFEASPSAPSSIAHRIGAKNLIIAIVTMPFVFLVVVMTIIAIFGDPKEERAQEAATRLQVSPDTLEEPALARAVLPIAASTTGLPASIAAPAGADAGAIALDGDRLAVRFDTDDGAVIIIYDIAEGATVAAIPIVHEPQD